MRRRSTALERRLLEREPELAALESALDEARSGRGRVYLVSGDTGIGKTTLVRELANRAGRTDANVRWGKSWEEGGAPAYWPWLQVLRDQVAEMDDAALLRALGPGAADVAQLVPAVGTRLGTGAIPVGADSQGARFRLFAAVTTFIHAVTAQAPLVGILEDLHAADEASLFSWSGVSRHSGRSWRCSKGGSQMRKR